ncbi:CotH kinase family protein [Actinoplanes awajinensis]|uniref:Spore coat protein CotH n=1 Tax=Actinoplanes awajinensis subsp. mycoplanecinus TaxID=135947 RepID=A0A101J7G4_9ACTN|nr:CotH kinase family protein [Actinoplanes awajinensis]KUL21573.1 spore coat protein CotH [Actinoplanes awajinensis subsp. mycoplanecinus]
MLPRRLAHRIPVRVRHYWKLLATCVAVLLALVVTFSTVRVAPLVTSASDESGDRVSVDIAGTTDLFDATKAHSLRLTFRDKDYQELLDAYRTDGAKEYLEADLVVDGVSLPSVGLRLKGNSTLRSIAGGAGGRGGGFGGGSSINTAEPETMPWLIRFDQYVDGRRYQGHREIAVRVGGMGGGAAVPNEAVALTVLAAAGETTQRYAYSSLSVNGSPAVARLIVEHPDENFATSIGSGVLYKALASSQFTDQGDDPTAYADDFKQINLKGSQDLQPVIDLVRWVNTSSDADFDAHLADHLDVASFARYAATQNLLLNFDDMAGPGRNYYLWYNLSSRRFRVVGWDYNLTFSGDASQDPHETVSMGGFGRGGGGQPGGGQPGAGQPDGGQAGFPGGFPGGGQLPDGLQPPGGGPNGGAPDGGGMRGGGGFGGHKLKERFLASSAYRPAYDQAYRELYQKIYGNGAALSAVDGLARVLGTIDGTDAKTEADQLRATIRQRTEALAASAVIAGS